MANPPRSVNYSTRLYQLMLYVYPGSFRKKYGWEMTQVFHEVVTDSVQSNGVKGLTTTWFRVLVDLFSSAIHEHIFEIQRKLEMKTAHKGITKLLAVLSVTCFWILPFSPILSIAAVSTTKGSVGWPRNLAVTGAALCVTWTVIGSIIFLSMYYQFWTTDLWNILNG